MIFNWFATALNQPLTLKAFLLWTAIMLLIQYFIGLGLNNSYANQAAKERRRIGE
jgi:hypothetical protein